MPLRAAAIRLRPIGGRSRPATAKVTYSFAGSLVRTIRPLTTDHESTISHVQDASQHGKTRTQSIPKTNRALLETYFHQEPNSLRSQSPDASPTSEPTNGSVQIHGWLRSVRAHKNVAFLSVSDGTTVQPVQAVIRGGLLDSMDELRLGCSLRLQGSWKQSRGKGQAVEFQVDTLEVLGSSSEAYPIQKKHVPAEVLREHAHLRFRTAHFSALTQIRDGLMRNWHDYFEGSDYTYIHTPITTSSDCEGAGEAFRIVTDEETERAHQLGTATESQIPLGSDPHQDVKIQSFFSRPAYLTVSSQLHLEAPVHAMSRVYTLSPTFRAEPSVTSRHLAEFYMLEAEVAQTETLDQLMDTVEDGIRCVLTLDESSGLRHRKLSESLRLIDAPHLDVTQPFTRITYTEAIEILSEVQNREKVFAHEPMWGASLQSEHEKYLAGERFKGPVFVTNYPQDLKPFYMRLDDSADSKAERSGQSGDSRSIPHYGSTVSCFDLLVPGIGELVGGSLREERLDYLEAAISRAALTRKDYEWYLDLRKYGSVKHGGWGMGWERFICWISGIGNVKDVVAFPRWKGHCAY